MMTKKQVFKVFFWFACHFVVCLFRSVRKLGLPSQKISLGSSIFLQFLPLSGVAICLLTHRASFDCSICSRSSLENAGFCLDAAVNQCLRLMHGIGDGIKVLVLIPMCETHRSPNSRGISFFEYFFSDVFSSKLLIF